MYRLTLYQHLRRPYNSGDERPAKLRKHEHAELRKPEYALVRRAPLRMQVPKLQSLSPPADPSVLGALHANPQLLNELAHVHEATGSEMVASFEKRKNNRGKLVH
jgi:hypothetical protein